MITVGIAEAETHFSGLLAQVAQGERVTITKDGVPTAMLVPVNEPATTTSADAVQTLLQFRQGNTLNGASLREMIEEGRE